MKKALSRILFLAAAATVGWVGLGSSPTPAQQPCPPNSCQVIATQCNNLGCAVGANQIGQCVDGSGTQRDLYQIQCPACQIFTTCFR